MSPEPPEPPRPPPIRPRLRMHRTEAIGMCLVATLPLLGLAGAFGPKTAEAVAQGPTLRLEVRYPSVTRGQMRHALEARVVNVADRPIGPIRVRFDDAYVAAFSGLRFVPAPSSAYVVELPPLAAGGGHRVTVELEAERVGRHRGRIEATHDGGSVAVEVGGFTFP